MKREPVWIMNMITNVDMMLALMGYTGALMKDLLGTTAGIASASGILTLWMLVPLGLACWIFRKKDL